MFKRERDFHKLIEQQKNERKDRLWEEKIKSEIPAEENVIEVNNGNTISVKLQRILIPVAASVLAVLTVILLIVFKPWVSGPTLRYCTVSDYTINSTDQTLKDFSMQEDREILYFDWYEETEFFADNIYKLNSTQEVICFSEEITDINTGSQVKIFVTDNLTKIDFLENLKEVCTRSNTVKETEIFWKSNEFKSCAHFKHGSNDYYLEVEEPVDENYIFDLVELLLAD